MNRVSFRLRLIAIVSVALCGVVAAVLFTPLGCGIAGGHWGSHWGRCVTPLCYYFGDCGNWLNPPAPCDGIKVGTSVARVYFLLGNPASIDGSTASWRFGKPESWQVRASFKEGHVVQLWCANSHI